MNRRRNRASGGNDPFEERPELTPEQAAGAAFGAFAQIDLKRPREMPVPVADVVEDPAIQVRIGALRPDVVEAYAAVLMNGGRFEDNPVFFTDQVAADQLSLLPPFILSDGWHRKAAHLLAYELTGEDRYLIIRGTVHYSVTPWEDARTYAETANLTHGLRLNNREKRGVLARRLLRGHAWHQASDSALAKALGVSRQTIRNWIGEIARANPNNEYAQHALQRGAVVGADGRVYETDTIREQAAQRGYTRPQKTARAAAQNMLDALERLERLGYQKDDPAFEPIHGLIAYLKSEWGIDDL